MKEYDFFKNAMFEWRDLIAKQLGERMKVGPVQFASGELPIHFEKAGIEFESSRIIILLEAWGNGSIDLSIVDLSNNGSETVDYFTYTDLKSLKEVLKTVTDKLRTIFH
jgi:hypothetical protein